VVVGAGDDDRRGPVAGRVESVQAIFIEVVDQHVGRRGWTGVDVMIPGVHRPQPREEA
jgi:hypothetical protein